MAKVSAIIPTLNAASEIGALLNALWSQTCAPYEVLVADSASTDGTAERARQHGARVMHIPRNDYDHGGTRDKALQASHGEFVLFLTQDAIPADERYIERLLLPFADARVAAVSGRQRPRPDARAYVRAVQAYRYPAECRAWGSEDRAALGIRAFHLSDVCSAYRRSAYEAVGGFAHPILTNEDMLIASAFLQAGYRLAYQGDAVVLHSHNLTLAQEYRRNMLVGRFLERYRAETSAGEAREGMHMAKAVLSQLFREGHALECAAFAMNCGARLLGCRAGRRKEAKERRG